MNCKINLCYTRAFPFYQIMITNEKTISKNLSNSRKGRDRNKTNAPQLANRFDLFRSGKVFDSELVGKFHHSGLNVLGDGVVLLDNGVDHNALV